MSDFVGLVGQAEAGYGRKRLLSDEPDVWSLSVLKDLATFVGRGKHFQHSGPAVGLDKGHHTPVLCLADGQSVLNRHDLHVWGCAPQSRLDDAKIAKIVQYSLVPGNLRQIPANCDRRDWDDQKGFIRSTVGEFIGDGDYDFGSVCSCDLWTSGLRRFEEDPRLRVTRTVHPIEWLGQYVPYANLGALGTFPLTGIRWGYKRGREWEDVGEIERLTQVARITVEREMTYPVYRCHTEIIYCRAIPGVDDDALRDTRSPGEADMHKGRTDGLRTTVLLGFHRAPDLALGPDAFYSSLDLELDPQNGRTLSIRGARACLASMLARMPVEHLALRNAIYGKSIW